MPLLTVIGGLTIATVAWMHYAAKLTLAESGSHSVVTQGYRAFLAVLVAHLFLPGIGRALSGITGWVL